MDFPFQGRSESKEIKVVNMCDNLQTHLAIEITIVVVMLETPFKVENPWDFGGENILKDSER